MSAELNITDESIEVSNNPDTVELVAELRESGWVVSDGYENVTVETQEEAIELLNEWYEDAINA